MARWLCGVLSELEALAVVVSVFLVCCVTFTFTVGDRYVWRLSAAQSPRAAATRPRERKAVRRRDPRVSNHLFAVGGRHDHEAVDEPGGRAPDLDGTHTHVHLALESWSKDGRQLRQTVCAAA